MTYPTVHLNGTSRDDLERQIENASLACRKAIIALEEAQPNARDYYTQGGDALRSAIREHNARVAKIQDVLNQLSDIYEHIVNH